jgi:hypothetical protein
MFSNRPIDAPQPRVTRADVALLTGCIRPQWGVWCTHMGTTESRYGTISRPSHSGIGIGQGEQQVARKTVLELVDDLDGESAADESVTFSVDGDEYEIDLSAENAATLRGDLGHWVNHAGRTGGRPGTAGPGRSGGSSRTVAYREQGNAVRTWAHSNGFEVSVRGRIPAAVQQAFDAAH